MPIKDLSMTRNRERMTVEILFRGHRCEVYHDQIDLLEALESAVRLVYQLACEPQTIDMSDEDRKILLKLVHPEKHSNSEEALKMYLKINDGKL